MPVSVFSNRLFHALFVTSGVCSALIVLWKLFRENLKTVICFSAFSIEKPLVRAPVFRKLFRRHLKHFQSKWDRLVQLRHISPSKNPFRFVSH